jgi:hypothetical protein
MHTSLRICAAVAAIALGSAHASACDDPCGSGYFGYSGYNGYGYNGYGYNGYGYNGIGYNGYGYNGYYGHNGYGNGNGYYGNGNGYGYTGNYAPPVIVIYAPPPVYTYAPPANAYLPPVSYFGPTAYGRYYAPVAAYRGPRWGYGYGGYRTAPWAYGPGWRRPRAYRSYAGPRFYARPYRAYARGPVRRWRRW